MCGVQVQECIRADDDEGRIERQSSVHGMRSLELDGQAVVINSKEFLTAANTGRRCCADVAENAASRAPRFQQRIHPVPFAWLNTHLHPPGTSQVATTAKNKAAAGDVRRRHT